MTVKQKLINMLVSYGMFESQATQVFELAKPIIDKQADEINGVREVDGKKIPVSPYKVTWDAPSSDYPDGLYSLWFITMKPVTLKWIDDNAPQAWFRGMFV